MRTNNSFVKRVVLNPRVGINTEHESGVYMPIAMHYGDIYRMQVYFTTTSLSSRLPLIYGMPESSKTLFYGPLARYEKLRVTHAPGISGTFSPPQRVGDPDMPESLTSGFLWNLWRGKRSRHSRRMRNLQFYVSGKRPIIQQPAHVRNHRSMA